MTTKQLEGPKSPVRLPAPSVPPTAVRTKRSPAAAWRIRHIAVCIGDLRREPVAVRIHRESLFEDVFGAAGAGREQLLEKALQVIRGRGTGIIVYLRSADGYAKLQEWQTPETSAEPLSPKEGNSSFNRRTTLSSRQSG